MYICTYTYIFIFLFFDYDMLSFKENYSSIASDEEIEPDSFLCLELFGCFLS